MEQKSDFDYDRQSNAIMNAAGIRSNTDYKKVDTIINKSEKNVFNLDKHDLMTILQIGTAFIPVAGPFISAGIGLVDAKMYYNENNKQSAGLVALLSMLPVIGKIPAVKKIGAKGIQTLAQKLALGGKNLTLAEKEIATAVANTSPEIEAELKQAAPKLKKVITYVNQNKINYIKKYGQDEYNKLLRSYLWGDVPEKEFLSKLGNVKSPTIKIKPVLGGGADHRVFQSSTNPNVVFKAELRPGEVDKWYNLFTKNENIFAKTFKKTRVKDTNGKVLSAVVMEKLDTKPFIELWDNIEKINNSLQSNLPYNKHIDLEKLVKSIKQPEYAKRWNDLIKNVKTQNTALSKKVDEFNNMVNNLYKITTNPDIRKFNLGYDKNGVLKALDI